MDYKKAGVDIEAGYKSVELMKAHVKKTMREEVLGGLGGFSGAFSLAKIKEMEEPVLLSGTDGCGNSSVGGNGNFRNTDRGDSFSSLGISTISGGTAGFPRRAANRRPGSGVGIGFTRTADPAVDRNLPGVPHTSETIPFKQSEES